jgi:hypothetical protein
MTCAQSPTSLSRRDGPWRAVPARSPAPELARFSLHAGVSARKDEHKKLERLCRYIARPAVSGKRLSLLSNAMCVTSSKRRTEMAAHM